MSLLRVRATRASPLQTVRMKAETVGIVVPTNGIGCDVFSSGIEFPVIPNDPFVVISLPKGFDVRQVPDGYLAAHRALETTYHRAKGAGPGPTRHRLAHILGLGIARKNHDAMEVVGHDDPGVQDQSGRVVRYVAPG